MIVPYTKSIIQHHPGGAIFWKNDSLDCMTVIDTAKVSFEFVEILTFDLKEVTKGNGEYIDK